MRPRLEHLPADVLGLSPFARAVLAGRLEVERAPLLRSLADLVEAPAGGSRAPSGPPAGARPVRLGPDERAELARTLEAALAPLGPPVAVLDGVRALAAPGTGVVVARRAPGFLAAPLATLWTALHVVRLADALSGAGERRVVPVLVVDGDAHELDALHPAWLVNENLDLRRVGLAGFPGEPRPASRIVATDEGSRLPAVRAALARLLEDEPCAEAALDVLMPRAGESLARAVTRALLELLGHRGLVPLEPDWLRADLSRGLAEVCGHEPVAALARGVERLAAAGLAPALPLAAEPLAWQVGPTRSRPLRSGGEGLRYPHELGSRTADELAAEIVQDPADFVAGAALTALVTDLCLPVVARVGEWRELEHLALQAPLRAALDLPPIPFAPRASCTIAGAATREALGRAGTTVAALLRAGVVSGLDAPDEPAAVVAELFAAGERAATELLGLRDALAELDPALRVLAKRTAAEVRGAVLALAQRAERLDRNRRGTARRHLRRLASELLPRGHPQEAVLGPLGPLARFGPRWPEAVLDALEPLGAEHLVLHVEHEAPSAG